MLFVIKPKGREKIQLRLDGKATTIGRSHRCTVKLSDSKVSRVHCVIEQKEGRITIRDLNSKNGIKINGKLQRETHLKDGDVILIGHAICLFKESDESM